MKNAYFLIVTIFSCFSLICGCECSRSCRRCYPIQDFDKMPFPLTSEMRERMHSTNWNAAGQKNVAVFPLSEIKQELEVFQKKLRRLAVYYMQSTSVIKIGRKDIVRKEKNGSTLLYDQENRLLDGVYVIPLYKRFYAIMDIHNGIPDGACLLYYYQPALTFYA